MSLINDKLKTLIHSLVLNRSDRKPLSPLNQEKYKPTQALYDLQSHLSYLKQAAYSGPNSLSSEDYIVQKDPYTSTNKIQFEEAFRADGMSRMALLRKADFVFAKGIKTVLDTMEDDFPLLPPNTPYDTPNDKTKQAQVQQPMQQQQQPKPYVPPKVDAYKPQ